MEILTIRSGFDQLPAFYHSAKTASPNPLLVICHGFCGSADGGSSPQLAATLLRYGISTLRFSFSPQRCLSQQIAEISAVIEHCRQCLSPEIALLGRSMGAAASLVFAAQDQKLAGLCLMASPADLRSTFQRILGADFTRLEQGNPLTVYHEKTPVNLTPAFIDDFNRYDLPLAASKLDRMPLLVIHGLEDKTVPPSHGQQLYAAALFPKQLMLLPGVTHSFTGCADYFIPGLSDWLTQTVFPRTVSNN